MKKLSQKINFLHFLLFECVSVRSPCNHPNLLVIHQHPINGIQISVPHVNINGDNLLPLKSNTGTVGHLLGQFRDHLGNPSKTTKQIFRKGGTPRPVPPQLKITLPKTPGGNGGYPHGPTPPQWAKIAIFGSSRHPLYFRLSVGNWMSMCYSIKQ